MRPCKSLQKVADCAVFRAQAPTQSRIAAPRTDLWVPLPPREAIADASRRRTLHQERRPKAAYGGGVRGGGLVIWCRRCQSRARAPHPARFARHPPHRSLRSRGEGWSNRLDGRACRADGVVNRCRRLLIAQLFGRGPPLRPHRGAMHRSLGSPPPTRSVVGRGQGWGVSLFGVTGTSRAHAHPHPAPLRGATLPRKRGRDGATLTPRRWSGCAVAARRPPRGCRAGA
jgi:hypothetical protein